MNSKKRCLCCGKYYQADKDGSRKLPVGWFADDNHVMQYVRTQNQLKAFKAQEKWLKAKKEKKAIDKAFDKKVRESDLPYQVKLTQKVFNKMRLLQERQWFSVRGIEPYCISCGGELGGDQWAYGHFKTVGGYPELRFDPKNGFIQHNQRCNMRLSADIEGTKTTMGYKKGLIHRFGKEEGQAILDYCERYHEPKNYTCDDLIRMRKGFNDEIRELTKLMV